MSGEREAQAEIVVIRASVEDASELAAFASRTFDETFAAYNDPKDFQAHLDNHFGVQQQSAELTNPDVVTLLVRRNGALVAFAQVRRSTPPPCVTQEAAIEIHRFYVDSPAHGTGLATRLMQDVRAVAQELGGRHVWLGVWEHNPRAIAFYAKAGFADVGSQPFMLGTDRQVDRVMVAALESMGENEA